ncbi:hypothetical protein O0L34_g806 [Tuta absoluta]|nr:hypothetical protein O0L34_g806 [Tuta absoluta]
MTRILVCFVLSLISYAICHPTESIEVTTDEIVTKELTENVFRDIPIVSEPDYKIKYSEKDHLFKSSDIIGKSATVPVETKKNVTQKSSDKKYDAKSVYLEDVMFALKSQDWSKEELPCLTATLHMLRSLQNFTLWAVWDWDSISSQPQGLLFGNRYELGNFDECMNAPWAVTHPELNTQYCLAEIVLERTDNPDKRRLLEKPVQPYESALDYIMRNKSSIHRPLNELTWGGCVPVSCGARAVERLMATLLARSHLGTAGMRARIAVTEPCQRPDQPRRFDGKFYGFFIMAAVLVATSFTCTYLNCRKNHETRSRIIKSFCLKENAKDLLKMKKEGAEVLYGIRFLTIVFIVMDHQVGIFNSGPIINGLQVDQAAVGVGGMFILHDDLFVDTFFVLSGFLVATVLKKLKDKPLFNPLLMIVKRYLRLSVAFAVVIFFYVAVYPYIGSGPLWNRSIAGEMEPCRKNWWLSLLMLNNYVNSDNICIVVSWYIPCDFHFFLVSTLVFWVYTKRPKLGVAIAVVLAVASVLAPGIINYMRELPAIQLFTYDFVKNPRANEQFHVSYIKSHTRFAAYLVGFFSGYFFAVCRDNGHLNRISKKKSILGAILGLCTMTAVMLVGATYLWRSYHSLEGALYAALNRPIWACGVALLMLCCCCGRVPYIYGFLTWYPWVPLSRLSYGLYLTHTALITRNVNVARSSQHNDYVSLLTSSLGVIVIGCVASLCIWLFAEAPVNNLFALLVSSKAKTGEPREDKNATLSTTTLVAGPSGSGHLQSNLPSTIEISSKM